MAQLQIKPVNHGKVKADKNRYCGPSAISAITGMTTGEAARLIDHACQNAFYVNVFKNAEIQYTEYHASENGHYDWHHDIDWNADDGLDRKLSITVQLSDPSEYEGGDFQFTEIPNPEMQDAKQKGSVLIFPSYLIHQVSPVTQGVRKSLVAWFKGPKWQ